jgi:hypothetical protein
MILVALDLLKFQEAEVSLLLGLGTYLIPDEGHLESATGGSRLALMQVHHKNKV